MRNYQKDRRWGFDCRATALGGDFDSCTWSGFVNAYDEVLLFEVSQEEEGRQQ